MSTPAKGYWIGHINVRDPEVYRTYVAANAAPFARFNARFLVRGGQAEVTEGKAHPRHVVIEFASYADAVACYHSAEYQAAKALRDPVAEGDMVIVEGYVAPV